MLNLIQAEQQKEKKAELWMRTFCISHGAEGGSLDSRAIN